jgi:hypothetical protein
MQIWSQLFLSSHFLRHPRLFLAPGIHGKQPKTRNPRFSVNVSPHVSAPKKPHHKLLYYKQCCGSRSAWIQIFACQDLRPLFNFGSIFRSGSKMRTERLPLCPPLVPTLNTVKKNFKNDFGYSSGNWKLVKSFQTVLFFIMKKFEKRDFLSFVRVGTVSVEIRFWKSS